MIDHDAYEAAERDRDEQRQAERLTRLQRQRLAGRNDRAARLETVYLDLTAPVRKLDEAA